MKQKEEIKENGLLYIITTNEDGTFNKEIKQEPIEFPQDPPKREPTEVEKLTEELTSLKENQLAVLEGLAGLYDEITNKNE